MIISDEHLLKFKLLYKEHFGEDISDNEAYEQAVKLLRLMSIVHNPISAEQYNFIKKHRENMLNKLTETNTLHEFVTNV